MPHVRNLVYLLLLILLSPWLVINAITKGKYRQGLSEKLFGLVPRLPASGVDSSKRRIWLHAVSVGDETVAIVAQPVECGRLRAERPPSCRLLLGPGHGFRCRFGRGLPTRTAGRKLMLHFRCFCMFSSCQCIQMIDFGALAEISSESVQRLKTD